MPLYTYKCEKCGTGHDEYRTMSERDVTTPCPCGGERVRDVIASMQVNSTDQEYAKPLLSEALGVHPSQINAARSLHPDHEFTPDGRLILRSHNHRKQVMKQLGYHDRDGF